MIGPIPIQRTGELRATLQMESDSGACNIQAAWQVSDDGVEWNDGATGGAGSFTTFGTAVAAEGTPTYGSTFASFNPMNKRRLLRFGVSVWNDDLVTTIEACRANLRVDWRES